MTQRSPLWQPRYTITPSMARGLMDIEAARAVVEHISLPLAVLAELRRRARIRSTHYSTRIEGNRLRLAEAERVINGEWVGFHGRERDVAEVQNYWHALLHVDKWAKSGKPLTEDLARHLHGLVERGARAKPTPYRDGQNVIRDSATGNIVYLPPEAKDVPGLMAGLVDWVNRASADELPAPLVAALAHYQFVTIHPFYDGNGRTARLLATFVLNRTGYGLNGLFSLEEYHAQDLGAYYRALATHPHHNYYEGRAEADLTPWLEYFVGSLERVFSMAKEEALHSASVGVLSEPEEIRRLDPRAREVLALFARTEQITSADVARALGLSRRMARVLLKQWVGDGWLVAAQRSNRGRAYSLSASYRQYCGSSSAMPGNGACKDK